MAKQTYTTGQVLTAAQMTTLQANDYNWTVSAKTASYVLVAADAGTRITMSNAGATTITVNTALFTAGDTLTITNIGAGACTITAGTATVSTAGSLILNQYDSGTLYFSSTSAAIWNGANPGDITGITTGATSGLAGGVTSGTASLTLATAAKGDLLVGTGSNTAQVLTVGSNNQTLVADSTASTGLKWATPATAASGMTFINRTSFSAVSSQIFDSVFSSTYDTYLVVVERILGTTGTDDLQLQLRYGSTTQAASYYGSTTTFTSSTVYQQSSNAAQFTMASLISKAGQTGSAVFYVNGVGNTSEQASIYGNGTEGETPGGAYIFGCWAGTAQTYTGFLLKPSAGTMTGEVSIYGLAKA